MNRTKTFGAKVALAGLIAALSLSLVAGSAFAGKGGGAAGTGGKHGGGTTTYSGSFSLVLLNSTDGVPHYGQQITYNVTSNAPYYFVETDCSQAGIVVYQQVAGFYVGWPWSKVFTLQSAAWTGGAADCTAVLYSSQSDGSNRQNLATMGFHVYA